MTNAKLAGFITLLLVICCSINFFGVRWFGESEFWFALIKISLILGLIIGGLVVDLGGGPDGKRLGFTYWKHRELSSQLLYLRTLKFYLACSWCLRCSPRPRKRRQVPRLVHLAPSVRFLSCINATAPTDCLYHRAAYSFSGMEALAMTCGELQNPRANMTKAVRRIFWRILFFYVFGILIVGSEWLLSGNFTPFPLYWR